VSVGILYVVATPIGNLDDFTPRARKILAEVQCIAAEDTRYSRRLVDYFGIHTALQALHEHNEKQATALLLNKLQKGEHIALISDAGTPLISDPGCLLISAAHAAAIPVVPIPGASAVISALSVAGLPAGKFVFEGFLPPKSSARQQHLRTLQAETRTLVFYEAPHRLQDSVQDMLTVFGGERTIILAKELTKMYETVRRGNLSDLFDWLTANPSIQKGEFVLVVAGAPAVTVTQETLPAEATRILRILQHELPLKQAAKLASTITGLNKNALYKWGLTHLVQQVDE